MSVRTPRWPILLALATLLLAMLACGGFQVRVTPTPRPPTSAPAVEPPATLQPSPTAVPTRAPTPTAVPTPTSAPTPVPAGLAPGAKARIAAGGGLNVREQPSTKSKLLGRLNANTVVTLVEGPTQAENYDWWKVDNGTGLVGWIASGPKDDPWLVPAAAAAEPTAAPGAPRLVDRPIRLGDRVQVTTDANQVLTVRDFAGRNATPVALVRAGTLFTVRGGPIKQDGFTWWELEGDTVKGWAAEGDGQNRWLTPVE